MTGTIIFILIAAFVIFLVSKGIRIVQQSETMVIERLGKYDRTLSSGINIIWPIIDKPRDIIWRMTGTTISGEPRVIFKKVTTIDLRETVYDFPKQNVITRDNIVTEINALLYFQVIDPFKAVYEIENLPNAIEKLTQTTLRNVIGEMDLDDTLTSRDVINSKLRIVLDEATNKWGVKVNRVELQDINPPRDIRDAMEKQMRAERDRRARILEAEGMKTAQILEAEGSKQSDINMAEGRKQAQILAAQGEAEARVNIAMAEAEAIRKISDAIKDSKGDPVQYLIALKYISAFEKMNEKGDNKLVYLPYEASSLLSSIGSLKDLIKG
jgi:regulator of protease activity HflC (stomatin/prohibitin superfamily)